MRRMAAYASFSLDGRVLENERAGLLRMAVEASGILRRGSAELMLQEPTMRVVAVIAADEVLVHAMMERLDEIGLGFQMAGVTKLRKRLREQSFLHFR